MNQITDPDKPISKKTAFGVSSQQIGNGWLSSTHEVSQKLTNRFLRHLTRRTALIAALLAASASGVAATLGPASASGQVLLVLVGILVSVVVLPDSPHRLWNVTAEDLADTVPSEHLMDASRKVGKAIGLQASSLTPEAAQEALWEDALNGVLAIIGEPSRLVGDVTYRIRLTPGRGSLHAIETMLTCQRCLPSAVDGLVWFSYCSSLSALSREFSQHTVGCLSRELIEMLPSETADEWVQRVRGYRVEFEVNGRVRELERIEEVATNDGLSVRFMFRCLDLTQRFLPTTLSADFEIEGDQSRYPVKFSAYFVYGATKVNFAVRDAAWSVDCDEYLASAGRNVEVAPFRTANEAGYRISAPDSTILPPGAGAVFSWRRPGGGS